MKCKDNGGKRANGDPCERDVMKGSTRCALHGGLQPISKIKAEQALALARMPAIEALHRLIDKYESVTCTTCGYPKRTADEDRVLVGTCKTILDRTGLHARVSIETTAQSDGDLNLSMLTDDERRDLLFHLGEVRTIKTRIRERQLAALSGTADPRPYSAPVTTH